MCACAPEWHAVRLLQHLLSSGARMAHTGRTLLALLPLQDAARQSTDVEQDSLWLVYKWEGLRPISLFLDAGPPEPQGVGFFKRRCARVCACVCV